MKKVIAATVGLMVVVGVGLFLRPGVTVEVRNIGDEPLRSAVIHVTGASYQLGDIPAGSSKQVVVRPRGESHIVVEQAGHDRLEAGCYFEPGYRGVITVELTPTGVRQVSSSVYISLL